jgi:hypothetical protein
MNAVSLLSGKSEEVLIGRQNINILLHVPNAYPGLRVV